MDSIGVIGVGHIGTGLVDRLRDESVSVVVYDIADEQIEYAVQQGATAAGSPAAVVEQTDCVLLALPGTPEVESTMGGADGILNALEEKEEHMIIDVTTTQVETSITYESRCAELGARFLKAPITGGSPRDGMHMMVGATAENYDAATKVLSMVCDDHTRIGKVGEATVFKLALQMRYAGHHAIDAEIVEFLRDNDVDPTPLNEFLELGVWEKYFSGDFSQTIDGLGTLAIWHKDVGYARQAARENDTALPLTGVVHEAYKAAAKRVDEDEGHATALIKYWEALNDAENR